MQLKRFKNHFCVTSYLAPLRVPNVHVRCWTHSSKLPTDTEKVLILVLSKRTFFVPAIFIAMENCYVKTNDYSRWVSELAERHRQHDGPPPSPHNFFLFPADFTCSVLTIWPNPKYKTTYSWNKSFSGCQEGKQPCP